MTGRRRRVLIGTVEIAGILPDLAAGFRDNGCDVTTVIRSYNRFYPGSAYDVDISPAAPLNRFTRWGRILSLIARHDIFLFQWAGISLTTFNREFPYLVRAGKKIISAFVGSDVRSPQAHTQQFAGLPTSPEFTAAMVEKTQGDPYLPMRNLRYGELYSDLILSVPNQSSLSIRPYAHYFLPINLSRYACHIPSREVPLVLHAPSSKGIKGSEVVLAGLDRLKQEGVRFELRLLQDVPNDTVRAALLDADVVVDQLYLPLHGKLGIEAMASGCVLATANRQDYEPFPPARPIVHVDAENFVPRMRALLTDRTGRVTLAEQGRRYVEQFHDHVAVAARILERLDARGHAGADHHPRFFVDDFRLDPGEVLPDGLKQMTTKVVRKWGLPPGVDPGTLVARGLMV